LALIVRRGNARESATTRVFEKIFGTSFREVKRESEFDSENNFILALDRAAGRNALEARARQTASGARGSQAIAFMAHVDQGDVKEVTMYLSPNSYELQGEYVKPANKKFTRRFSKKTHRT